MSRITCAYCSMPRATPRTRVQKAAVIRVVRTSEAAPSAVRDLESAVIADLVECPGYTVREVARRLKADGVDVTKRDVNRLLYRGVVTRYVREELPTQKAPIWFAKAERSRLAAAA